jgi:hypothetical protein
MEEQIIDSAVSLFNFINKDFEQEVVECKKVLLVGLFSSLLLNTKNNNLFE